jgi:DUF1680 family protein
MRIALPVQADFKSTPMRIGNSTFTALQTTARILPVTDVKVLYQEISQQPAKDIPITLIPYYAWANRGPSDMTVWVAIIQ